MQHLLFLRSLFNNLHICYATWKVTKFCLLIFLGREKMKKIALGLFVLVVLGTTSIFAKIEDPCRNEFGGKGVGSSLGENNSSRCAQVCKNSPFRTTGNYTIINDDGWWYCCCEKK